MFEEALKGLLGENEKLKQTKSFYVGCTCVSAFFVRRAIKEKLEEKKYVEPNTVSSFAASSAITMGGAACCWGIYKCVDAGTLDGVQAGIKVGIIAAGLGIAAGELIILLGKGAEKILPYLPNINWRP